jgi:PAS domain S-box-containing protein
LTCRWKKFSARIGLKRFISEDRPRVNATWEHAVRTGEEYSAEFRIRNGRSGEYRWFLTRAAPYRNQEGQISRWFGTCTDIQKNKQIEQSLRKSEERFRTVLEKIPGSVFVHDLDGKFILVNDAAARNTGYPNDELLNLSVDDIDPESIQFEDRNLIWRNLGADESYTIESRHTRKDGSKYPVEVHLDAFELDGRPIILAIAFDITERKRAEEALRESEQKFRALFENSPEAVFLTFPDGTIEAANPAACAIFGWSQDEVCTFERSDLLDEKDPRLAVALQERQRTGRIKARELTAIRKNKERFPVEVDSVILKTEPMRSFVIMRDITKRKKAERELLKLNETLEQRVAGAQRTG